MVDHATRTSTYDDIDVDDIHNFIEFNIAPYQWLDHYHR